MDPRAQQLKELLADRFELVEFLGKGGFASVYRVRSLRLGRFEALKVLHKSADDDPEFGRRFRQEAMLAAALDHPSIVKIYDFGEVGGLFWYSMQLVDGPTLSRELRSRGRLPAAEAARLAIPVLDALEYSHQKGVIHRDVKPENVILDRDRRPYLMDFGIAKAEEGVVKTKTGFILGSPSYLSPEQLQGKPLDGRTDVYAMGVTLYEMLSGTVPFEGPDRVETLTRRLKEEAEPVGRRVAGLPPEVERIVARSLTRDRDKRYASARELRDALVAFLGSTGELALPVPAPPAPEPPPTLQGATRKLVEVATKPVTAGPGEVEEAPTVIERARPTTEPQARTAVAPTVATESKGAGKGWLVGLGAAALVLVAAAGIWRLGSAGSAPDAVPAPRPTPEARPEGQTAPASTPPMPAATSPQADPTLVPALPTAPPAEPTMAAPAEPSPTRPLLVEAPPTRAPRPAVAPPAATSPAAPRRGAPVTPLSYEQLEPVSVPDDLKSYSGRPVGVRVTIGADGRVLAAKVISPLCAACDQIVLSALRTKFTFTPARDADGNGVESAVAMSVTFGE